MVPAAAVSRSTAKSASRLLLIQSNPSLPSPFYAILSSCLHNCSNHDGTAHAWNQQSTSADCHESSAPLGRSSHAAEIISGSNSLLPAHATLDPGTDLAQRLVACAVRSDGQIPFIGKQSPSPARLAANPLPPHQACAPLVPLTTGHRSALNELPTKGARSFASASRLSAVPTGFASSAGAAAPAVRSGAAFSGDVAEGAASSGDDAEAAGGGSQRSLADEMIAFAQTCLAREGSDDAAAQEALRVVEHGASMLRAQGGQAAASQAARLLRFKAALHLRVHDSTGAVEALEEVAAMGDAGLCDRVGALEEVVRIHLSGHADAHAMESAGRAAALLQPPTPAPSASPPSPSSPSSSSSPAPSSASAAPPGLAFLRFRVLCSVGLVEQLCGHIATAREHFQEADELEPPDCNSVPTTGLARLAMALHLHSVGQWEQATSYYSQLIQCSSPPSPPSSSPPSSSSSPSSPSIASPSPTASSLSPSLRAGAAERVGALSGRGQLLLQQGDFKAAEEQFTTALKEAEAMDDSSDFNPMMGAVLSLLGDTYAQRGRLQHTGEGMIAEGLFRRALALLGAAQWDSLDHRLSLLAGAASGSTAAEDADEEQLKDRKNRVLQLDLIAFTLERYAAALQAFPMRASEAQSMSAAAHHLWRSPLSLDSAVTSSRVSAAAFEPMMKSSVCAADNPGVSSESKSAKDMVCAAHFSLPAPVVDVTTGRVLLS